LGKFAHEVEEELTVDDLADWIAWFKIKREEEEKAYKEAEAKAKAKSRRITPRRK